MAMLEEDPSMCKRASRKWWYRAVMIFLATYAAFCLVLFVFQRSLLYFPSHRSPVLSRLTPWTWDGETFGYCREATSPQTIWLMMHGNAGQASDRDYVLDHLSADDSLYVLEYPGYGARAGSPSRAAFNAAAMQAYERLLATHPGVAVCVIGESIGSGPAATLASAMKPPAKIVLITPFDTLCRVAGRKLFFVPVALLLLDRWDNVDALRGFKGAIDVYGAARDEVIPVRHARQLSAACGAANYHEMSCGHNDWADCDEVTIRHLTAVQSEYP